ncbi:MAG: hypothetical protein K5877_08465 [Lachnospiraceae bacterium]|nr:hypothetical protein [Lachnospiraceae bacterium]
MDKYEYKLRSDEIKSLIKKREFQQAVEIADTIDWTRVRSVTTLCTISDLYKINRRYKDAKILLEQAYERYPNGRMIVYSLCELCIKMEEIVQAIEYYKQFVQMAPTDNGKFVLQYKIYEAQDVSLEERIAVLEELKKRDYKEKWGYELAYLYHRIGLTTKCVEECDELIVWFREGAYVKKAMELKMLHQQLTESQMSLYESMLPPKERETFIAQHTAELEKSKTEDEIMVKTMDMSKYNTLNLQKELAESMKDVLVADNGFAPLVEDDNGEAVVGTYIPDDFSPDKREGATVEKISRTLVTEEPLTGERSPLPSISSGASTQMLHDTGEMEELFFEDNRPDRDPAPAYPAQDLDEGVEEIGETVATDTSQFPAFDPVKDLELTMMYSPQSVAGELEGEQKDTDIDEEAVEEAEIPKVGTTTAELFNIDDTVEIVEPIEATKVFNREELQAVAKAYNTSLQADKYDFDFSDAHKPEPKSIEDYISEDIGDKNTEELLALIDQRVKEAVERAFDMNRPIVTAQPQAGGYVNEAPPKSMENVLSQDSDGQISLVVPDAPPVEKQITGQMSINDILNEWENTKKQNQEKFEKNLATKVLEETGSLFTTSEMTRFDGLLEKLERDEIPDDEIDTEAEYEKYLAELMDEQSGTAQIEEQLRQGETDENGYEPVVASEEAAEDDGVEELTEIEEPSEDEDEDIPDSGSQETDESIDPEQTEDDTQEEAEESEGSADEDETKEASIEEKTDPEIFDEDETSVEEASEETAPEAESAEASEEKAEKEVSEEKGSDVKEEKEAKKEPEKKETKQDPDNASKDDKDYSDGSSRSMNDDELALFGQFAQTKSARQNLLRSLDKISLAAYTGNVFVTGETTEESVDLAKNVIRYVKNTDANFTGKIAKVSGEALNNKMVSVMVEKLANGGLIIEKASGMSAETTKNLLRALNQEKTGIVVALQDTKKNMHKMMEYFDGMKQIINVHIEVEELSDDALVAYGKKYAEHLEYSIDDMGILALHTRIDELQTSDHVVTVADVRSIIDEAIEKANKKTLKHFTDVLFAKRYDDEDMIILRENDFLS